MTTYTIAIIGDTLTATAVDGDDRMMADRLNRTLDAFSAEDRDDVTAAVRYITDLTLFRTVAEAEEAGAEIVYSGTEMGWLEDAAGRMEYQAAGRVTA